MEEFYITICLYCECKLSGTVQGFTDVSVWCHTSKSQKKKELSFLMGDNECK